MVLAPALSRDSFVAQRRRKQLSFAQSARHARTSEGPARRATLAHLRERLAPETFEEVREMVVCEWPESFPFRRSQRKRLRGRGMATSLVHGPVTLKRGKLRAGRASHEAAPSSRGCSSRRVFAAVSLAVTMGLPRFERPESSCTSRPEGDQDPGHPRWVPVRRAAGWNLRNARVELAVL